MRIGISVNSTYSGKNSRQGVRDILERVSAASRSDLDSLFFGDHHVTRFTYFQNTPILGRALSEWGGKPAGALYLLPLWNPVVLAEQIATLASIATGRFVLQCGLGWSEAQSNGLGVPYKERGAMLEASLDVMRRLWSGESVSEDKFWFIDEAISRPTPPEPIEVWIGASAEPAIERAARIADGWLAAPSYALEDLRIQLDLYKGYLEDFDKESRAVAIRRDIFIAEHTNEASKFRDSIRAKGHRGFDEDALIIGTSNEVADRFSELAALGFTDIIVRNISADQGEAIATIESLYEVKRILGLL